MMSHAELPENRNTVLWNECAATATKLGKIMVNLHKDKCAYKKF